MDNNPQKEVLKDMKTAAKFIRIGRTMLENIKKHIAENSDQSSLVSILECYLEPLRLISDNIDTTVIEKFKTEKSMPGCQLALDFGE